MGILLAENLLPALTVLLVKIGVHIRNVEFYVVTCTLVMTAAMIMEMGIYASTSTVYTRYNTLQYLHQQGSNESQDQDYEPQYIILNLQKISQFAKVSIRYTCNDID